jgi:hypothetical protein
LSDHLRRDDELPAHGVVSSGAEVRIVPRFGPDFWASRDPAQAQTAARELRQKIIEGGCAAEHVRSWAYPEIHGGWALAVAFLNDRQTEVPAQWRGLRVTVTDYGPDEAAEFARLPE